MESVAVQKKEIAEFQDIIKKLEDESKSLHECVKIQRETIKRMGNEIKILHYKFDTVDKDLEDLHIDSDEKRESTAIHEEIIDTLLEEADRKEDSIVCLKEAIISIAEECSSLEESEKSLQETIKIILVDFERSQSSEEVLKEALKRCMEEEERRRESLMCIVCMNIEVRVVFAPCGHLITCSDCSIRMNQCPLCRQSISRKVNIFRQ
ncbi:hypothetical protein J437_LFUL011533 [Ladona fulva]|uniref:RING-type domain-containing protein n=1 Tax=Ladona fulva TaxID=123851 RepID=A0A8K0KAB5_LADFU|nr:hypothetical protein J437_LFUL011533 [Ladona fulva]